MFKDVVGKVHPELQQPGTIVEKSRLYSSIERDTETNLYVGYVPGFPAVHSQGETPDEFYENLREVIEMLLEDENLEFMTRFVGTQQIVLQ